MPPALFKKLNDSERRIVRIPVLFTAEEAAIARESAMIRNLSVSDFIRRAALARKADVHYDSQIVCALWAVTDKLKEIHQGLSEEGRAPITEQLLTLIAESKSAIKRIDK